MAAGAGRTPLREEAATGRMLTPLAGSARIQRSNDMPCSSHAQTCDPWLTGVAPAGVGQGCLRHCHMLDCTRVPVCKLSAVPSPALSKGLPGIRTQQQPGPSPVNVGGLAFTSASVRRSVPVGVSGVARTACAGAAAASPAPAPGSAASLPAPLVSGAASRAPARLGSMPACLARCCARLSTCRRASSTGQGPASAGHKPGSVRQGHVQDRHGKHVEVEARVA